MQSPQSAAAEALKLARWAEGRATRPPSAFVMMMSRSPPPLFFLFKPRADPAPSSPRPSPTTAIRCCLPACIAMKSCARRSVPARAPPPPRRPPRPPPQRARPRATRRCAQSLCKPWVRPPALPFAAAAAAFCRRRRCLLPLPPLPFAAAPDPRVSLPSLEDPSSGFASLVYEIFSSPGASGRAPAWATASAPSARPFVSPRPCLRQSPSRQPLRTTSQGGQGTTP